MKTSDSKAVSTNTVRLALMCMLTVGLLAGFAQRADAHDQRHRAHHWSPQYTYTREYRREFPRWLRHDRDFRRWYHYNRFHHVRRISWNRLYDVYRHDRAHHAYKKRKHWQRHARVRNHGYYADTRRRRR